MFSRVAESGPATAVARDVPRVGEACPDFVRGFDLPVSGTCADARAVRRSYRADMQTTFAHGAPSAQEARYAEAHPVDIDVQPALTDRNRLTSAFRIFLALPHIILVGGPIAFGLSYALHPEGDAHLEWGGAGVLGAVAIVAAVIGWFAIVFGSRYPAGLWNLAAFYMRWRVRAVSYTALLRDEYPPFGDGAYPAMLRLDAPTEPRDRLTVAFRPFLALPHIVVLWVLGVAWGITSIVAWFVILFTGRYPESLYGFAVGVFRWSTRVEAYLLLLRDEYPPFSLGETRG